MADSTDDRSQQLLERENALCEARATHRAERGKLASERAEVVTLLSEARSAHRAATEMRDRARRLASRFVRFVKHRNAEARRTLEADKEAFAAERQHFSNQVAHLNAVRTEFHSTAAAARDRLRDAWATVETQQKRAATEWAEANSYFLAQTAILDARTAELASREKTAADRLAQAEAETAGLREEAAALEERVSNSRAVLAELEAKRENARSELLRTELPDQLIPQPNQGDYALRELHLLREKASVAALRSTLERESADLADSRRLVAEQLGQLAEARMQWQKAERQTVVEMEELARALRHREQELDAREQRLIHADVRRRNDSYDLWQLRIRLEAWQTKLTAFELRWHTEREQLEDDLERRISVILRRETALEITFARWEQARNREREQLRSELAHWAHDRARFAQATVEFDKTRQELLAELTMHAARALAAEQLLFESGQDTASARVTRRFVVLRRRWERVFDRKVNEINFQRDELAAERVAIEERYRSLHSRLVEVVNRETEANNRAALADRLQLDANFLGLPIPDRQLTAGAPSDELAALRAEVERLATTMLEIELPEPPPTEPPESELPWASEDVERSQTGLLPFDSAAKAA
jgi:chromosome segregation ATPase